MKLPRRCLALLPLVLLLASCEDMEMFGDMGRFKKDFNFSYPLASGGHLSVENSNGSVEIDGWEKDSIEIVGTKYASSEQFLNAIRIDVTNTPTEVRVRTVLPSGVHWGGRGARYTIHVPSKVQLDRITSSNGSIRVDGIQGAAVLRTSNGSVKVVHMEGSLRAQTSNSSIDAEGLRGSASLETSNGSITATDLHGAFDASTSNSRITATIADPEPGRTIRAHSSNGSVDLSVAVLHDNPVDVSTSNSSITLHLPATLNAALSASTSNSSIENEFSTVVRGNVSKHSINGTIGQGGPPISLTTSNGGIKIRKT